MPLFMLISGYLFFFSAEKRELEELVEYKTKSLLYPILTCSILNLFLSTGIVSIIGWGGYTSLLDSIPLKSLWFLWSVLACSISMSFTVKQVNPVVQSILILVGFCIVALFPNCGMNVYMYPYFVIGYFGAKHENRMEKASPIIGLTCTLSFIGMMFFFEKKHYIYTTGLLSGETRLDSIGIDFFRWAVGLSGSISVIWISRLIYPRIRKHTPLAEQLGQNSLAVYVLSVSLLSFWLPRLANSLLNALPWIVWNDYILLYNYVVTPIIALAYSFLLLWIIGVIKKWNIYRLIFGR